MKAVLFDGSMFQFIENHPTPEPRENEALIRVRMAGICATDLEISKGYKNFRGIPGHEFIGIVKRVNGSDTAIVGKRVVGEINCGCGECDYCASGMEKHCAARSTLGIGGRNGVFAEFLTIPQRNLRQIPEGISDEEAVFVEPLAAAFEILEQLHIRPTQRILVLGDGRLGLLTAMMLRSVVSAAVSLCGRHESKLSLAARQGVAVLREEELSPSEKWDVVIESTGSPEGLKSAITLTKPRGTIVLKSTTAAPGPLCLNDIVINELTIIGSRCGPFDPAVDFLATRKIDVKPLISAVYPFNKAVEALKKAADRTSVKVLLDFRQADDT
jgi:threonine dehydrogenase-like Zn-dependent dehydrogenase